AVGTVVRAGGGPAVLVSARGLVEAGPAPAGRPLAARRGECLALEPADPGGAARPDPGPAHPPRRGPAEIAPTFPRSRGLLFQEGARRRRTVDTAAAGLLALLLSVLLPWKPSLHPGAVHAVAS